ncbi:60s ribosomal protein l31 [Ceraceosorus bombacis]|uniref:60s ribosomal protein l31 n=2 Tax=Ceraceosorus TaxID=401624 RepID=A0A0P1BTA6_9BASI|nr:hypothetical protein IE81DRAFT_350795 [Ceraceosorus guamensis]PWN38736.1 hypothetical protein IE81DRAFT_350795 [Ceraceosorus guamensis]CEH19231.1 60s ribosomal protein l31 [Ceraceosorus bombacis]
MARDPKQKKTRSALDDVKTIEASIHLHKRVHGLGFKHRSPRAVKEVRAWVTKLMGTKDVRLDPKANHVIWQLGIKDVPRRLRFRLERKRNDDDQAKERLYTLVTPVLGITNFHGLQTTVIDQE